MKTRQKKTDPKKNRAYRHWTKSEEADLVRQARRGMFLDDIARAHARSEVAIEHRAQKLNLQLQRRPNSSVSVPVSDVQTQPKRSVFGRLFKRRT